MHPHPADEKWAGSPCYKIDIFFFDIGTTALSGLM
jgi:hypothetical protein